MAQIQSLLWKSGLLSMHSVYFPHMVQAAAWYHGKTYSDEMLQKVATTPDIITTLKVDVDQSVDVVLAQFASDPTTAGALDNLILNAVAAYTPAETHEQA